LKIAITADLHLTTKEKHPERFQTLRNILLQCQELDVNLLIIAGDLFDKSQAYYDEFESLYKESSPPGLKTIILPGNHDLGLKEGDLLGDNLAVFTDPSLMPLNKSRKILFLPYQPNKTMGELIAPFAEEVIGERWILISHGDWIGSRNTVDPYEKGSYLPLTKTDLANYQPEVVFLGHIHLPQQIGPVYYPGSPCPINISEIGPRRFLIFDTLQGTVESQVVDSPLQYQDEQFVMLPTKNDLDLLITEIKNRINEWEIPFGNQKAIQVRVRIGGITISDRKKVLSAVKKVFSSFRFYQDQDPDLSSLSHNLDPDRAEITKRLNNWLEDLDWESSPDKPDKKQITEEALKLIYGGNS
jgi:DNA repair exonuclease SbcCD nuclease subunit